MSELNEIAVTTLSHIFAAINSPGKQIVTNDFNIGNYPVAKLTMPQRILDKVSAKSNFKKATKDAEASTSHQLDLLVFKLQDGQTIYLHPHYGLRKVNGSTAKARHEPMFVIPSNAKDIYRIVVNYTGSVPVLNQLALKVFQYV